jgi:hypothetical protein
VTRPARFTQPDLTRAANAMRKAGLYVTGARIAPDGSIEILTGMPEATNDRRNPLDRLYG